MPLVVITGLLLCAAGVFWPATVPRRSCTIAVTVWPGAEGLLMTREMESIRKMQVNFMELSWPGAVMGAFQKRVADAAVVSLDELLRLEAGGAQPQIVLVLGMSRGADAILARQGLNSVKELRGKRVGVEVRSSGEYLLACALQLHGMTLKDVEVVPLNLAETETAYAERGLAAVVTTDPWRARLLGRGAVVLHDSSAMGLEMSRVLIVRREALAAWRRELQEIVAACLQHPPGENSGSLDEMLRREDLDPAQWAKALQAVEIPDAAGNRRLLSAGAEGLATVLLKMQSRMREQGLLTREIEVESLLNDELVKEGAR